MKAAVLVSGLGGLILSLTSCNEGRKTVEGTNLMGEAVNLAIYDHSGYEEVVILNPEGKETARYILVDKKELNKEEPEAGLPSGTEVIKVPVENLVVDSEIYASALEELGAEAAVKGIFDAEFVTSPGLQDRIAEKKIENVGKTSSPSLEKIISLDPDAMMISYFDGMETRNIEGIGVPIIKMYDLQEPTPLGRAEWIRLIGRLTGQSEKADSIYAEVKKTYTGIAKKGIENKKHPKVITDLIYQGVWYVPGGESYQARLLKDAGARYFQEKDKSGRSTLNLTPEQVMEEGGDAEIWIIKHYGPEEELRSILASDPVYKEITAYREHQVYYSDTSKSGLFREFPFHPEKLLNDYRIILSGESGETPRYFKKLE